MTYKKGDEPPVKLLKQPKLKSSPNILECLRKGFKHIRDKECVAAVVVLIKADGTHYVDAVVPLDNVRVDETLEGLEAAHELVYNVGK